MAKDRYASASQMVKNRKLVKTKTVWGLTVEEIEFCAYVFYLLCVLVVAIGLLYVLINVKQHDASKTVRHLWMPFVLFIFSIIPMSLGIYGIFYENKNSLILFAILDVFSCGLYLYTVIVYDFMTIGAILILILLVIQLVLSALFIHNIIVHKQIFKKELPKKLSIYSRNDLNTSKETIDRPDARKRHLKTGEETSDKSTDETKPSTQSSDSPTEGTTDDTKPSDKLNGSKSNVKKDVVIDVKDGTTSSDKNKDNDELTIRH